MKALFSSGFLALLDELGQFGQFSGRESVSFGQLSLVIALAVISGSIVPDGEAWPHVVVITHIPVKCLFDLFLVRAFVNMEVHEQLLLDPAVERLVDRVVGRLAGSGHGAHDESVPDQLVVCHGGIDTALVGVQHRGLRVSPEQADDVLQTADVLFSASSPVGKPPCQDLLGEHVKVERHLKEQPLPLQGGHVRYHHLPWAVHRLPCRENQVGVPVAYLPRTWMGLVLGLGLQAQVTEAFIDVVVTDAHIQVVADICGHPSVAVGGMLAMHLFHHIEHGVTGDVP